MKSIQCILFSVHREGVIGPLGGQRQTWSYLPETEINAVCMGSERQPDSKWVVSETVVGSQRASIQHPDTNTILLSRIVLMQHVPFIPFRIINTFFQRNMFVWICAALQQRYAGNKNRSVTALKTGKLTWKALLKCTHLIFRGLLWCVNSCNWFLHAYIQPLIMPYK